ncbi:MAG: S8 family serine peptidase [Verrucomicrobia bacterium]|nr:S8 family serine peptidase [Verrucomicrobiota bacterium]
METKNMAGVPPPPIQHMGRPLTLLFSALFSIGAFGAGIPDLSSTVLFEFSEPRRTVYFVERPLAVAPSEKNLIPKTQWVRAWLESGKGDYIEFGNRIVLQIDEPEKLLSVLEGFPMRVSRQVTHNIYILEAKDTWIALDAASELSNHPLVSACYPVSIRPKKLHGSLFSKPNDPYFAKSKDSKIPWQAYLENRDLDGTRLGVDLNVRAAWTESRGTGIVIAVADDGVDLTHPDLAPQAVDMPHFSFTTFTESGVPAGSSANHGTAVAGLALAKGNNKIGISGVAPEARLASWVLFNARDRFVLSDETLMDMFQYKSNVVSIQNHSWGNDSSVQFPVSTLENIGISNAVAFGRSGLGTVIVRAGGNGRERSINANDDGYLTDPRVIGVAAARLDGKFARYSSPGACLLVAAPSGDEDLASNPCSTNSPNLLTTDRQKQAGYNSNTNDLADYGFGGTGFNGTSASTPQISGAAALILAANTNLTYRDVQQILILSSRHYDSSDPDLLRNAAGFQVSHNLGFGIPDTGIAVTLATTWRNRPATKRIEFASNRRAAIPDEGLRVRVTGDSIPIELQSIIALPALGPFPDSPTEILPAADVGTTVVGIADSLTGRAALIERGENYFCEKLSAAAAADAAFAIVYNNRDTSARIVMGATEYTTIPAVFINQRDGEALRDVVQSNPSTRVQLSLETTNYTFQVPDSLLCEHVSVRINGDHTSRGDMRITLLSPQGTRSVLQSLGDDDSIGPRDWTYMSTHHFYENSAGNWTIEVSDLAEKGTGSIRSVRLMIDGVPINDSDRDGLDDSWERAFFGNLAWGAKDDPDDDGYSNAWEQIAADDPSRSDTQFRVDIARWNANRVRLSWPGKSGAVYRVSVGSEPVVLQTLVTNVAGAFPETEIFIPYTNDIHRFYQIEDLSKVPLQR